MDDRGHHRATSQSGPERAPTPVDAVAEDYVTAAAALDPILASRRGIGGHEREMPDLSPDGLAERSKLRTATLARLDAVTPVDTVDRITIAAMRQQLSDAESLRQTGFEESNLNNIESPIQAVREAFDLMLTATVEDWATIAARLCGVPDALAGYRRSLQLAASRGRTSAARQVQAGIAQAKKNAGATGFFASLVASAPPDLPATVRADLERGGKASATAYEDLGEFLSDVLLPTAPERDAIGREQYPLYSRTFLGADIDIDETYAWGQAELARIDEDMRATAERIMPGATVREAMDHLNADTARTVSGTDALVGWMQGKADAAIAGLAGEHFDIPEAVRHIECRIAPSHTGVIYYTGPSEDFSRPGRMWWSVPDGVERFSTWRELTTVHHEGVPGHHLQVSQAARNESLNRWRRRMSWVSGYGEGWALYAERLMGELGFLDEPADYLGMLDGQSMRAARVVLDIGIHCDLEAPAEVGGGKWSYQKAWQFFARHCAMGEGFRRFELERYLGWPGQAPAYKVGERMWMQLREDARSAQGDGFSLKEFHRRALDIGSVGLDVLRAAMLGGI